MGYSKNKRQNANIWNFRSEMESLATFSMVLIGSFIVDDSNKNAWDINLLDVFLFNWDGI